MLRSVSVHKNERSDLQVEAVTQAGHTCEYVLTTVGIFLWCGGMKLHFFMKGNFSREQSAQKVLSLCSVNVIISWIYSGLIPSVQT